MEIPNEGQSTHSKYNFGHARQLVIAYKIINVSVTHHQAHHTMNDNTVYSAKTHFISCNVCTKLCVQAKLPGNLVLSAKVDRIKAAIL